MPLDLLMMCIASRDGEPLVGWCMRVKDLNIKKCTLVRGSPEALGHYVGSRIVVSNSRCISEGVSIKWLQDWLHSSFVTDFRQQAMGDIPDLIVSMGNAPFGLRSIECLWVEYQWVRGRNVLNSTQHTQST